VEDHFCQWNHGKYEMDADPDGVRLKRSREAADLVISVADLASCYMGSVRPSALAQAGRVEERTPGSAARADAMFATRLAPWCPYAF
jgi:predicted acetyltransferase